MPAPNLTNTYIFTARSVKNANGSFAPPTSTPYGGIPAHIAPDRVRQYTIQADSNVVEQYFTGTVDQNADVGIGDIITNITLLDGKTPYPPDVNYSGPRKPSITWSVWNELPGAAGNLPQRKIYLKRTWGGGPTTL